ncbi:hypothetical protein AC96_4128 [Escherichia coli 2-156-04_S4_C2]|nr:hypothetical protein AC96_4128 [Escherichia coli 2-156-04_S4_C2]
MNSDLYEKELSMTSIASDRSGYRQTVKSFTCMEIISTSI